MAIITTRMVGNKKRTLTLSYQSCQAQYKTAIEDKVIADLDHTRSMANKNLKKLEEAMEAYRTTHEEYILQDEVEISVLNSEEKVFETYSKQYIEAEQWIGKILSRVKELEDEKAAQEYAQLAEALA